MPENKARYITTTLPYVNSDPHIGFAYEMLQADVLARFYRLQGDEVFFSTGTDEHGQKIADKADGEGRDRQAYVDHFANEFKKLADPKTGLNLSFDNFVRTTDAAHKAAAQAIWRRCLENGDIYKKKYSGLYCVGDEAFIKETDLVEGRCPNHPTQDPIQVEEENYFFRLSNYQTYLEEYLSREGVIEPKWRQQEALNFVKTGLEDFSISRERGRLEWGVPVPDDETQVMYVWFDALTNYISTLGWPNEGGNFEKFWVNGETLQLAGKDQVRFQSIMWQAMLKSAGIKATDKVLYHGFINSGGHKMSKSIGNVISPYDLIARYGIDATRYLLLRHVHPFDDSDITGEKLDEWYTANLVNGLGNLVARVMKMSETHLAVAQFTLPQPSDFSGTVDFDMQKSLDHVWHQIQKLDEMITLTEPFKLVKTDAAKAKEIISSLRESVFKIAIQLKPFLPQTADTIAIAVQQNKKPDNLFVRLES